MKGGSGDDDGNGGKGNESKGGGGGGGGGGGVLEMGLCTASVTREQKVREGEVRG